MAVKENREGIKSIDFCQRFFLRELNGSEHIAVVDLYYQI